MGMDVVSNMEQCNDKGNEVEEQHQFPNRYGHGIHGRTTRFINDHGKSLSLVYLIAIVDQ